jgi:membrane fusion protein (multidrug efflux system)
MSTLFDRKFEIAAASLLIATALTLVSCTNATSAAGPPPPPDIEVAPVKQRDVPIYHEWIGTLDGMVNAAIRAQVTGYLLTQKYSEGSFVRKGQLLFEIDPRPFQAAVDQARGQLAQANGQLAQARAQLLQSQAQLTSAEANQRRTQLDEDRYVPLAKQQAITQQDLDNATQNNLSSKAQVEAAKAQVETAKAQIQASGAAVEAAKAALETAQVNLGFTRLISPIDGIAGVAQTQVGNLVGPASNAVTTVSTLDPIKVNFTVSEQEYLNLTRQETAMKRLELELILGDASVYPHKGKFAFADREVNQSTGAIQLTGLFPNPGNTLRPGQYGKVRAAVGTIDGALLVPQRAVTELQGSYQVAAVDNRDKVSIETVKVGDRIGPMWVITDGLKPGQRVVAEGVQKVMPGMQVNPKPFTEETQTGGK